MNILISGFSGKMGQVIYNCAKKDKDLTVTEGFVLPSEVERLKTRAENNRQEFWQLSQEEGKEMLLLAVRILFFFLGQVETCPWKGILIHFLHVIGSRNPLLVSLWCL